MCLVCYKCYIVMFVNMSLCYMWIKNVNRSLYVRFVSMSLCYILYSYVRLYAYAKLYAYVMIELQCLCYIVIRLC
jgi:hypothetical protein